MASSVAMLLPLLAALLPAWLVARRPRPGTGACRCGGNLHVDETGPVGRIRCSRCARPTGRVARR